MVFFVSMFICNLLIPLVMIVAGYLMYKKPPKEINDIIGYRTWRAKKNLETWKFAHNYCGKLWVKLGLILIVPTIIAQIPFVKSSEDIIACVAIVIEIIQLAVLLVSIFVAEKALRKTFDNNGNRIA